jgi:hypothetical protein
MLPMAGGIPGAGVVHVLNDVAPAAGYVHTLSMVSGALL